MNEKEKIFPGLLAHSVIKSQQMATGIAGKPLANGVSQNGKKSPTPGKCPAPAPAPPVNVPPPPCAPYCPKPGQLKIEKKGKIVNDLVDIDFEQTVMKYEIFISKIIIYIIFLLDMIAQECSIGPLLDPLKSVSL